jgi:hypothetical protein
MMRSLWAAGLVLTMAAVTGAAEAPRSHGEGSICIAAFHPDPSHGPRMDDLPGPGPESKYSFRVDHKLRATVGEGEMARIPDLPTDRKVLVEIRLDGDPTESFRLDLGKEEKNRACLWLYMGYWHWVNTGWDEKNGCRCK